MQKRSLQEWIKILVCSIFLVIFVGIIEHYKQQAEICNKQPTVIYVCDNILDIYTNKCNKIEIFKYGK